MSPTPPTASRPDYLPESYWDATANAPKADAIQQAFETDVAHQARLAARPEKADGYELKFPDGFTPEVAVAFDDKDPRLAELRTFAHEQGWDQPTFSRVLQIEAARVTAEAKAVEAAHAAEINKLGSNGTARVTAVKTFLGGIVGKDQAQSLMDRMVLAGDIEALEKLQHAFSTQGGGAYSNGGREPPPPPKPPIQQRMYGATTPQQKAS